jgi:sugar lactone lactonase YvrE
MPDTFKCPSCGAPLEYSGNGEVTINCPFCHTSVIVPETLRTGSVASEIGDLFGGAKDGKVQAIAEIGRLVRANQKLEAIKLYRETFNADLQTAKDAVEAISRGEPIQWSSTVTSFTQEPAGSSSADPLQANAAVAMAKPRKAGGKLALIAMITLIVFGIAIYIFVRMGPDSHVDLLNALPTHGDGSLLLSFGTKGIGPGQFTDARSIAVDPQGNIYLGEYDSGRILAFDATGKFSHEWTVAGKQLILYSLAVDRNGIVYADFDGKVLRFKGDTGESIGQLQIGDPEDDVNYFALTPDGEPLIVTSDEDITRYDAKGQPTLNVKAAVSTISGDSELEVREAVDGRGNIFLLGTFNEAVFKYSSQGNFINRFGSDGDNTGQFSAPENIAVDGLGRVYVTDFKGVQVFDGNGRYLGLITMDGAAFGMATDDQNNLYVITNDSTVNKFKVNVTP